MIPDSQEMKNKPGVRAEDNRTKSRRPESVRPQSAGLETKKALPKETKLQKYGRIGRWFQIICCMNIPVIGFLYMVVLACSRKTEMEKKAFAKAYVLFRILVFFLAIVILYVLYRVGLDFVDGMLRYAK